MDVLPNLDWYISISKKQGLSPRCPFASVYRCPRFYQSLSLLGEAGNTQITPEEDNRLKQEWQKTDVWPITDEQATTIAGPRGEIKHFSRFCPEVLFDRFGLFTSELHEYPDEIDINISHKNLLYEDASQNDWRWNWSHVKPTHYTECVLYSLLRVGKERNAPKPVFPNIGMPDSITKEKNCVILGDEYTAKDIEELIEHIYEHPEIKTFEFYSRGENPHLQKAINDYKIVSDTVEANYYKHPDRELVFMKIHKNTAESDWEKHLVATSPMYFKRIIALTDKQRRKMEMQKNQTIWDKVTKNPVVIILMVLASIATIVATFYTVRQYYASKSIGGKTTEALHQSNKMSGSSENNSSINIVQNNSSNNPINVNQSNNANVTQTQNVPQAANIGNKSANVTDRFKDALRSLDDIDAFVYSSIDYEPQKYLSLLSRARNEIKTIKGSSGKTQDFIMKTYSCYHNAGEMWKANSPSVLVSKGVVTLYKEAEHQFTKETRPSLSLKWKECSKLLGNAHEYFQMEK
ncbi:MAG: hypothetical protein L6246_02585 [Thermodesulfovibrionales bacterium]|nr:hypothetical protein [Nitrospinota bacterium]MCG2709195.1 hypothetical protein [Thermodesulfovibrionales bacterium]